MSSTQFGPGKVFNFVSEDFRDNDPVRTACINIANFILRSDKDNLRHLTFAMLREAAKLTEHEGNILHRAIEYLTGDRANLLIISYEYIDDEIEHVLEPEEEQYFLIEGNFIHPHTGEPVDDCAEKIYIFFRPNYAAFH